ncbi:hypothetical protein [Uliginosibacterium gangwonense]|uniref:hypothetical protein n=1 Tax=Uliginosibacterium gangwonense TaxID=392736 RepID=UPI00037D43BC|nr:hypothetical protein [Uliginosibacterium gangwonense]
MNCPLGLFSPAPVRAVCSHINAAFQYPIAAARSQSFIASGQLRSFGHKAELVKANPCSKSAWASAFGAGSRVSA